MEDNKVTLIWHVHYYNGAIHGLCRYQNREVWFQMISESWDEKPRKFQLFELSQDNLQAVKEEHERFRKEVGWQNEYDPKLFRPPRFDKQMVHFTYKLDYEQIKGAKIIAIDETNIVNYNPPKEVFNEISRVE